MHKILIYILLSLIIISCHEVTNKNENKIGGVHKIDSANMPYRITNGIEYLSDETHKLKIEDVISEKFQSEWQKSGEGIPNFGMSNSVYWLRFNIKLPQYEERFIFEVAYPSINKLDFYEFVDDKIVNHERIGGGVSFEKRKIKHKNLLFYLTPDTKLKKIYLKVYSLNAVQVPMSIWTKDTFYEKSYLHVILDSCYYGAILIMILYNFFIFFLVKDKSFLYFSIYAFFQGALLVAYSGYGFQLLWSSYSGLNEKLFLILVPLAVFFAQLFTQYFMDLHKNSLKLEKLFLICKTYCFIIAICAIFLPQNHIAPFVAFSGIFGSSTGTLAGVVLSMRGNILAKIYLSAWMLYFVGVILFALNKFGIIPITFLTEYSMQIGSLIQLALLSGALGYRINLEKKERFNAEEKANKLTELDKQKTHFFQNISHELRTPLTLIMNPIQEAYNKYNDDLLEMALKNINRLYRLVNQLLDFQKVSSQKNEIELVPIDLTSFLKTCAEYFKSSCDDKKIRFSLEIKMEKNAFIMANVDSLEKIVFNYLSNALKYTKSGGYIQIKLDEVDGNAKVSVLDSGKGITLEDQKKLFKVFSQVDDSSSREFEGTGLGLALVKELAKKMNGDVGFENGYNDFGSLFWVKFKIASNKDLNVLDVLFIDDDDEQVMLFRKYMDRELSFMNYKAVGRVEEAREILKKNHVKCILSDAIMPDEDGISFLTWVLNEYPKTTRVLITGRADTHMLEKAINESLIDYFIQKPWQMKEMKNKIREFVKTSKLKISAPAVLEAFTPKDWLLERDTNDPSVNSDTSVDTLEGSEELVLVVDDLKDMRVLISNTLKKHGYRVFTAINGEDALKKMEENKPDIIVTDWMMPHLSGVELINKIKSDKILSGIPAILLTAKTDEESKGVGIEFGADGFIGKPFSEMELISVVKNNLRLKKREKEVEVLNYNISQNILKRYIPKEKLSEFIEGKDIFSEDYKTEGLLILTFDIPNFNVIIHELGISNVATLLNDYLENVSEVINKNDGMISKIDTCSITAIFGYNENIETYENINLAISSIEAIKVRLSDLEKRHNLIENKITFRAALHHGIIRVGFFGGKERSEFMAIGKPVEKINEIKSKLQAGDMIYTKEVLDYLQNEKWASAERIKFDDLEQGETFFRVIEVNEN